MTPAERKNLQRLDDLVLNSSSEELKNIQEIDQQTQMEGVSYMMCMLILVLWLIKVSKINLTNHNFHS